MIERLIDVASQAGAGVMGKYSHCAFITKGVGTWKSEKGAHPFIGKVGETSTETEVKIEMICFTDSITDVVRAIREVHPYEEPAIDFWKLEE